MSQVKKNARVAGLLYTLMVLTGPFVVIYVPGRLFVPGNPAETAANIFANQSLFRAFILVGLFSEMCFIATVLALYRLLKDKGRELATVMVILVLVEAPMAFRGVTNQVATLSFVQSPELLAVFDQAQRNVLATFMITIEGQGSPVSQLFCVAGLSVGLPTSVPRRLAVPEWPCLLGHQLHQDSATSACRDRLVGHVAGPHGRGRVCPVAPNHRHTEGVGDEGGLGWWIGEVANSAWRGGGPSSSCSAQSLA